MPEISVVIPVYNAASFLQDTIDSVLCQTFRDFELIVLDDGSTDQSVEIIGSYSDPRISCIECVHDFVGTVSRGYDLAKGKYIARLDHDDLMMPKRLQIQHEFMETNPHIAACGGWIHSFGNNAHEIRYPLLHEQIVLNMLLHEPILNPTGFFRRQFLIEHHIKHQREYSFYADFKFLSEIAKRGRIANIPQILTLHRTSDEQTFEKYLPEGMDMYQKIKFEMMEYLLSRQTNANQSVSKHMQKLMPVLMQLKDQHCFSEHSFLRFMHELIGGLLNEGLCKA